MISPSDAVQGWQHLQGWTPHQTFQEFRSGSGFVGCEQANLLRQLVVPPTRGIGQMPYNMRHKQHPGLGRIQRPGHSQR